MITYVNTVFVGNLTASNTITSKSDYDAISASDAGKFVVITVDANPAQIGTTDGTTHETTYAVDSNYPVVSSATADLYERIKIGMVTDKVMKKVNHKTGATTDIPVIKWSNIISANSVKSYTKHDYELDSEDTAYIDFNNLDAAVKTEYAKGGKRIIVRLTFKDMPHRMRKWTESYEYVTKQGDTEATIAVGIANMINKEWKRARVSAIVGSINTTAASANGVIPGSTTKYFHNDSNWGTSSATTGKVVQIKALQYDDDNSVDSLSWANKVRFNINIYWTDPAGEGWEANNKHFPKDVTITKVPGKTYIASAKLVRDREAQAMGYLGILNHGEGTWPIIQPAMTVNLNNKYCATTLEFERMYRAADDHQRTTKETVEIYNACTVSDGSITANGATGIRAILDSFITGNDANVVEGDASKIAE